MVCVIGIIFMIGKTIFVFLILSVGFTFIYILPLSIRLQSTFQLISSLRYQLVRKRELNLENNDISMIYSQNIEQIEKIHKKVKYSVKISHNPIYCDCKAFDLVKFLNWKVSNESKGLQFEYMNTKCEGPVSLKNKLLKDIVPKDLICQLDETCTERDECDCFYQTSEKTLIVDCSNNHLLDSPHLKIAEHYQSYGSVDKVEVHLEGNSLNKFSEKLGYTKVSKLFLQNNFINNVSWIPPSAQVLDMRNNSLGMLDLELLKMMSAMNIEEIHLGNNPWNCDCQNIDFSHFLEQHISNVADANNIKCNGSELSLMELNDQELCPVNVHRGLIALLLSLLFSFIIVMNVLLCYVYRRTILTWLYAERLCLWLIKEERIDKSKIYDAFVSFANQDEKFVVEHLVPVLEKEAPFYKLCLHMRDWVPGEFITTQINRSVRISRRTLVILSSSFLKSVWGKIEFRTAHTEALKEGRVRVIVIVYGDVDLKSLDDELKAYLRTNTYIQWGDPWFWEKLRYALPRRHKNVQR